MTQGVVVLLTAFDLEYRAVRQRMTGTRVHRHPRGTRFEVGSLENSDSRIALGLTGKGNHAAGILAERAIEMFAPLAVVFVGVAGALQESARLGDVVVATHVYAYHGGTSEDDGLKARPRVWEISHAISQLASHLKRVGDWTTQAPAPSVHFGAIAAGEVVQNSSISAEAGWLRQHYNDALAIEMEAAGVAQAGHLSGSPIAIVRGISDRADGTKTTTHDGTWQPRAAENAAAFATRLAEELTKEGEYVAMGETEHPKPRETSTTVHNTASSSTVGIQAAHVSGSTIYVGAAPDRPTTAAISTELTALRQELHKSLSKGALDSETHEAARAELDLAGKALEENTPESRGTVVLALKRLGGLTADLADLATKVAALITAAKGLS
ncbi:5'-methylthioadenosine/S-adenosylhomocysteine nucleosidase [Saccharomonospora piscinae]|uniref:5'-methylthioadenosine/S-adenosylhomocysteine nucleosidase family protein n=1 Tax=Saccharomonospora piscinae TaxID=687388 RepID=UPI0011075936|nr:5'-methylthioadenosine/S-adenosylhomocysteine nucleosidase [Saccharomonospora piscinae]TLW91133.1 5'-methylthioadenosine/S-adenosylhomocysteine nucleosidase [Saccharomonospora piscinae]